MKKQLLAGLLLSSLLPMASAQTDETKLPQPGTPAFPCTHMTLPQLPADFSGAAKYQVRGTVAQGKITSVEVKTLEISTGFTRKLQRAVVMNISLAVQTYECERDGTFEQVFAFRDNKPPVSP